MMSEDGKGYNRAVSSILELEPQEVPGVGRRASAELDCEGRLGDA
jgi:hypothetical protein